MLKIAPMLVINIQKESFSGKVSSAPSKIDSAYLSIKKANTSETTADNSHDQEDLMQERTPKLPSIREMPQSRGKIVKTKVIFHNPNIFPSKRFSPQPKRVMITSYSAGNSIARSVESKPPNRAIDTSLIDMREELVNKIR